MRGNSDLLDGFQVGAMIGGKIADGMRYKQERDYRTKRDEIEDTFKREQLAQQGEDRGLRRQETELRLADLGDAMEQRKKDRLRQGLAEQFAAQGIDNTIADKVNSLKLRPLTAPSAGAPNNTPGDPLASSFNSYFAYRNQIEDELNTARASGDPQAIRQATEKWQAWSALGPQIAQSGIVRQTKKQPAIKVKSGPQGNEYEMTGDINDMNQIEEFTKRFGPKVDPDEEALKWARANPNDPRAATIKAKLGVK